MTDRPNALRGLAILLVTVLLAACQSGPTLQPEDRDESAVYSNATFDRLIGTYAGDGGRQVDYASWKANPDDLAALDRQVDLLARVSPDSHPEQFTSAGARRSYWINSYNTLVIHAVLEHWPLTSVREVKLSLSSRIIPGKGFFYDREVVVGGWTTNLLRLERRVLKEQRDPRLHFALNCASDSCPVLRSSDWTDAALDRAARDFVNDPANVQVLDGEVWVSRIFKWYRREFPDDLLGYLAGFAGPELAARLEQAASDGHRVRYFDYDWDINAG